MASVGLHADKSERAGETEGLKVTSDERFGLEGESDLLNSEVLLQVAWLLWRPEGQSDDDLCAVHHEGPALPEHGSELCWPGAGGAMRGAARPPPVGGLRCPLGSHAREAEVWHGGTASVPAPCPLRDPDKTNGNRKLSLCQSAGQR